MRRVMGFGLGLILGLLALTSCGRDTLFLHHLESVPVSFNEATHALKQLEGQRNVDILFVIDDSGSMGMYQEALATNADKFIDEFSKKGALEWKIGIITTSMDRKPVAGFAGTKKIDYRSPNGIQEFGEAVRQCGTRGDTTERSFAPVEKHLTGLSDFIRPEATLAIIFLTDAQEQSETSPRDFLGFLQGLKQDPNQIIAYGAFAAMDFGCDTIEQLKYKDSPYEYVINETKGKAYSLDKDFGSSLADLGKDLVTRVQSPFIQFKDRPQTASIRVTYQGLDLPGGPLSEGGYWIYDFDRNRIVFHNLSFAPGDEEEVTVSYDSQPGA